jgi:membrane fusion protein, heavy metal efflux system
MKTLHHQSNPSRLAWTLLTLLFIGCSSGEDDNHEGHEHETDPVQESHDGDEHAEGEDGHIELTETQFLSADIEVTPAQPGRVSEALILSGTIAPNSDSVLQVTPRFSGQIRSIAKHLGESVKTGEVLCVLDSVALGAAVADYLRDRELVTAAMETLARERDLYAGRLAALAEVLEGAIEIQERIFTREKELQEKALTTMRPLIEADKALQLAKLDKVTGIIMLTAERDARVLALELDLRIKRIDLAAAANHLKTLGLSPAELEELDEASPLLSGEYRILASGNGVVVNRRVSRGEFFEAGAELFVIEDLTSVWFIASAFEEQLRSIRSGQSANVSLDAFPGTTLNGVVSFLDYHVDPTSRSVGVRITLDNAQLESWSEELPLRPGMFGSVELETTNRHAAIVLPERALVHEDAGDYVFVQVEPFAFERRDVTVTHVANDMVEITSGLEPGEMVAISGTFLLKSAERQGELGGGHSH